MSKQKYVQSTLILPSEMPLFNYNINFEGLRKILEGVEVKTNRHEEQLQKLQEQVDLKLPAPKLHLTHQQLSSCFLFGVHAQDYIDRSQASTLSSYRTNPKNLNQLQQFCEKMKRMAEIVDYLMDRSQKHQEKIGSDKARHQKLIDESFRRLEDKLNSGIDSFGKTINNYFGQTNQQISELQSQLSTFKKTVESKLEDVSRDMGRKVSQGTLKAALEGSESKVKHQLEVALKTDHMLRLSTVNQVKQALKEAEKDIELKNKAAAVRMQQMSQKVSKALQTSTFQAEKHKIYEKISQIKNRSDELVRKNNEFVEFRKNYLGANEKIKQEIRGLEEEITKMHNKEGSFKKLENMSDVLNSLNPHLICELGEEVKLHTAEIGKLQKLLHDLGGKVEGGGGNEKPIPEVGNGQNSDLIQKILKEYTSNMDFEGRMKRNEKELQQMKKKHDAFLELQKKLYSLSKEVDMGALNKELKRKADQQTCRKDSRILDGKIEQLFEFYKQLRKEVEERKRVVNKSEPFESATLTTKRLLSANCISCNPSTPARRQLGKSRMEMSLDYSLQGQRHTLYSRTGK